MRLIFWEISFHLLLKYNKKTNHRPFGFNEVHHNRQVFVALCDHFLIEYVFVYVLLCICMGVCVAWLDRALKKRERERKSPTCSGENGKCLPNYHIQSTWQKASSMLKFVLTNPRYTWCGVCVKIELVGVEWYRKRVISVFCVVKPYFFCFFQFLWCVVRVCACNRH